MKQTLLSWIGFADLNAAKSNGTDGIGPIAQALYEREYDYVRLLVNFENPDIESVLKWLKRYTGAKIEIKEINLKDPTDFDGIYKVVVPNIEKCMALYPDNRITIHLSPGTPAMGAVWILLSKTRYDVRLIQSSKEQGVKLAMVPFDISGDYIRAKGDRITDRLTGQLIVVPGFEDLTFGSPVMSELVAKARRAARYDVGVLIEGESGTGKELLAGSIHKASHRADKPFIPVNCGAIPNELIESYLFGHKKGSFTGAVDDHKGVFRAAEGGTVFLDEVGELDLGAQVKLLRILQEGEVMPVGETMPRKVNVRIISATNRSLNLESQKGKFRTDLFYRLAVAVLVLPPLRERGDDLSLLIDTLMHSVQSEVLELPKEKHKKLSENAKNILLNHDWPGNIRELANALARACLWSDSSRISTKDAESAVLSSQTSANPDLLALPFNDEFNLMKLLDKIESHYISRALIEASGKKSKATNMLGLNNYQSLTNKMKKYGIE